jgi:hypothetical protein
VIGRNFTPPGIKPEPRVSSPKSGNISQPRDRYAGLVVNNIRPGLPGQLRMRAAATCIASRSTRKALLQCLAKTSRAHGSPVGLEFLRPGCPTISTRHYNTTAKRQNNDVRIVRNAQDTIYALSTANGRAGIAIVRISGAACLDVSSNRCAGPSFETCLNHLVDLSCSLSQEERS